MNRGEVRDLVRTIIDEPHSTGTWSDEMLNVHLNLAYRQMANKVRKHNYKYYYNTSTITVFSGLRAFDLPDDCVASNVLNIRNEDGNSLIPSDIIEMSSTDTDADAKYYDILDNKIFLDPMPTVQKTYTLEYFRVPEALLTDNSVLDFPVGQEDVIAYKTAVLAKKSLDGIYEDIEIELKYLLNEMLEAIVQNKYIKPPQIEISRGNFGRRWVNN